MNGVLARIEVKTVSFCGSYLLGAGLLQRHPQAAGVLLVVGDQLSQRGEGDLIRHEVGPDGGALDPEVVHLPLAAGCETEGRVTAVT